ncbi:MAG: DUF642 domain-containing protein, partial [Planctomycetota bacterium]
TSASLAGLADGQVHHLAVTWDNTNGDYQVWIDGALADTGTDLSQGSTIGTGGTLMFGQEQDSLGGAFESEEAFQGSYYDVRIWNEVRSTAEIALNHQHKFDGGSLPSGLIANWQMDGFNGSNEVVDVVGGNNLSIGHASGAGFTASTPVDDLHISENANDGASVGYVVPSDPDAPQDIVVGASFHNASGIGYAGGTIGDWDVIAGNVDAQTGFEPGPLGGKGIDLNGTSAAGTIRQTLMTEVDRQYQVIFALGGNWSGGDTIKDVRVSAGDESHDFSLEQESGVNNANMLWQNRSFTFTADGTSTDLTFASMDADSAFGPAITDVRVIEIPQPISTILNNDPTLSYDAATGKFYRAIDSFVTPTGAITTATSATLNGVSGQLATVRSAYENEVIRDFAQQLGADIYLGATDRTTEGDWYFLDGNTDGEQFSTGSAAEAGYYTNWLSGEPNGGTGENYLAVRQSDGVWIDVGELANRKAVIEWDASEVLSSFTFSLTDDAGGRFAIDSSTGEITVADSSLLDYETATTHNVTVETTDAGGNTYSESMAITVDNVLDANQTVPSAQTIDEDTTLTFTTGTATEVSVTDTVAGENSRMRVTLSVNDGILTLSQTTGLTFVDGANGSGSFVIDGTESDINAALDGMTFTPDQDFNGSVTLNMNTALAADLQGHYTFEGGNADDQSVGITQNGTLNGDAAVVTDAHRGEVLSLDGDGDYVEINSMFGNSQTVTLSAWVNLSAAETTGAEVISLGDNVVLRARTNSGEIAGYWRGSGTWHVIDANIDLAS